MKYKVGDICEVNKRSLKKNDGYEIINYLDTANLNQGRIDEIVSFDLLNEKAPSRAKRIVQVNDILISTVRPNQLHYGLIENPVENLVVSTGFTVLSPDLTKVDPFYLYSMLTLQSTTEYLQSIAEDSTSAYPAVKPNVISNLSFDFPELSIQRKIGTFFKNLFSKIELNNQMIATLEELAATLFKRWFVDFEFPDENGNPYKSSGGKMVDSELGEIPEGWSTTTLGSQVSFEYGKSLTKSQRNFGTIPVYGSNGIVDYHDKELVSGPGIIIGRKGTVGTVNFSSKDFFPIDTTFWVKILTDTKPINYFYFLLKNLNLDNLTSDSAVPGLNRNTALRTEIVVPTERIINHFERTVETFRYLSDEIEDNIGLLGDVRDSLLPKILSGEIEV